MSFAILFSQDLRSARDRVQLRVSASSATKPPVYDFRYDTHLSWTGDALVTYEKNESAAPVIHSFDENGRDMPIVVAIPQAELIHISSAARSQDGYTEVAGFAWDSTGHRAGFISRISPNGTKAEVTRMSGLYLPQLISIAPDGSTWVKGWEPGEISGRQINRDASIIRHFNKTGSLDSGFLSQASLSNMPRFRLTDGYGFLVTSATRAGWHPGFPGLPYYEFLNGSAIEYPSLPMLDGDEFLLGLVITERDEVFASTSVVHGSERPHGYYLYTLDRQARRWRSVALPVGPESAAVQYLIGVRGNTLVFKTQQPGVSQFFTLN